MRSIVVKYSTLAGGVFIEVTENPEYQDTDRAFLFDAQGRAQWAYVGDLKENGVRARWYGHQYTTKNFVFA